VIHHPAWQWIRTGWKALSVEQPLAAAAAVDLGAVMMMNALVYSSVPSLNVEQHHRTRRTVAAETTTVDGNCTLPETNIEADRETDQEALFELLPAFLYNTSRPFTSIGPLFQAYSNSKYFWHRRIQTQTYENACVDLSDIYRVAQKVSLLALPNYQYIINPINA